MKKFLLALATLGTLVTANAADVGVSVSIGDPHFYGQITIGDYPRPQLLYERPVVIVQQPRPYEPIYLRVPPGHAKNWARYCAGYNACGRPVYFVRDDWYTNVYAPRYRHDHDDHRWEHDDRRWNNDDRGHDRGHGHGRGHDHWKDRD
ncbi:hypothetical protein SAMN02745857_03239 [Andreprevotia lacus DSM 23236]|jgi:hypothetical protein|uniref:YXWGXW repeat-containing protein n=1 Tax=Andreprevotia lacus DSM 23236 TaxID=1121001 RepID=A0A1W1XX21_9NEIS|nr:hypothetical protein [Andreprevotia lacus]SMC28394.1 hypothetical protein SAMN02745857_03239 [Andreprevotia lacus DSM 23236]